MIEGEEAKHAVKALRLREGDEVELCDGAGCVVRCAIAAVDKGTWRTWLSPLELPHYEAWSGPEWVLAVGCLTLKGGRSEWLVEKATELGARELMPLSTARSLLAARASKFKVKRGGGDSSRGSGNAGGSGTGGDSAESYAPGGRLERVAVAATKQSLRPHGLLLRPPVSVIGHEGGGGLLEEVRRADVALLAAAGAPPAAEVLLEVLRAGATSATTTTTVTAIASVRATNGSCSGGDGGNGDSGGAPPLRGLLLVGPEGDFTPEEVEALVAAGAKPVGLGANRLRTETAAVALLSLCVLLAE